MTTSTSSFHRLIREAEAAPFSGWDFSFLEGRFEDVGAIVYLLRAVPWQLPGFSVATYEPRLRELHDQIQNHGPLVARDHRYYLEVEKHENR